MNLVYDEIKRPIYWKKKSNFKRFIFCSLSFNVSLEKFEVSGTFPDSPKCGYNNAKCPKKEPLPIWAWLLIAMSVLMIIITTFGFVFYRYFEKIISNYFLILY